MVDNDQEQLRDPFEVISLSSGDTDISFPSESERQPNKVILPSSTVIPLLQTQKM